MTEYKTVKIEHPVDINPGQFVATTIDQHAVDGWVFFSSHFNLGEGFVTFFKETSPQFLAESDIFSGYNGISLDSIN